MISSSRRLPVVRTALLTVAALGTLTLAACGGDDNSFAPSSSAPPSTPSSSPSTTTPPPKPAPKNPLTGVGGVPEHPVIAVKIDDTPPGRPQVNIDKADVVYVLAVEGGLTRLIGIYATTPPHAVGYVRSTRPGDAELLLQYGKITEAYSGGARDVLPGVHRSGINSWSMEDGKPYFHRVSRPESSYINVLLDVAQLANHVDTPRARSIGWTFGPVPAAMASKSAKSIHTVVTGANSGGTSVDFRWDPRLKKFVRYIDGVRQFSASGKPVAATNVIVQSAVVKSLRHRDVLGNPSQYTHTIGSGAVSVFRDGRRIDGTWFRGRLDSGTALRAGGKAIPLEGGNTWVVLIRKGVPVTG
jgi:Protein of unknown function (DUF3048) N-terminal domain/Protein of unknown function (DUF3048) C-terminal domain